MGVLGTMLALLAGLCLSAFFSGTETALTALPASRVDTLRQLGGARGWAWKRWRNRPHRVLVSLLVGNTIVNIGLSAIVTEATIRLAGSDLVGLAAGLTTLAVLVFGEVTPKTLARVDPEVFGRKVILPVGILDWLLTPLALPLLGISHVVAKLRNVPLDQATAASSPEDLRFLISLSRQEGHLTEQQESMLEAVLRFENALVREVQIPRTDAVFLRHDMTVEQVRETVRRTGYSRYPVVQGRRDENVIGVLMAKDLLPTTGEQIPWTARLKPAHFVPESMRVVDLLRDMRSHHSHLALSVDEYGNLAGVVSMEDVLELIVGDIRDEHDTAEPMWRRESEHAWIVRGSLPLARLAELTDTPIEPDSDYTSVAGLLLSLAGRVPEVGESFTAAGLKLTVTAASARRVDQVRVSLPEPGGPAVRQDDHQV